MPTSEMANKNKGQKKKCQEGLTNYPKKKVSGIRFTRDFGRYKRKSLDKSV